MDESAEWRRRYDAEVEKVSNCINELKEVISFSWVFEIQYHIIKYFRFRQ